jgi:carboxymethylenebutenolidase
MISFQSGTRQLEGYVVHPEGEGPFPALVLIHEAYGLNENIKDIARRFADQGYVALNERLGAIGYCMGGSFAISWACTDDRLKAIAPYYAGNPRPLEAVARLCPVVGSYPDNDFTTTQGQKLDVELDRYQVPHNIKIYPGAKHSFFNDQGKNYNEAAAKDSWERVLAFFREHIGVEAQV